MTFLSLSDLNSFNDDQEADINEEKLNLLGGVASLEKSLGTNFEKGISGDEKVFEQRRNLYGKNEFPEAESETWLQMFLDSFEDTTLIVLIVAAVVSLAVGIYEDPAKGWIEGGAILFAVVLVAIVTATNNYQKEAQFRKLNAVKDDINVGVIRGGDSILVNVKELVVGDIVRLNSGDKVPADGVFIEGSDLACNESALTGESDNKRKSGKPCLEGGDIFLISGATVASGYCHMLVTAVGENSRWGKTKSKLSASSGNTPLQDKLDILAGQIGNLGMASAAATFVAMVVIYISYPDIREEGVSLFEFVLKAFIMAVTIVVVAVPEGLPLAVTLSLAYSTQKMMLDNNLIRVLAACETMGNATNICSDKTGTLTQNRMTVVQAWVAGTHHKTPPTPSDCPGELVSLLTKGISINSTAVLIKSSNPNEAPTVNGSNTEGALLMLLENSFSADYSSLRATFNTQRGDKLFTFSSAKKCMTALVMTDPAAKRARVYTKGAAEVIVGRCDKYIGADGTVKALDEKTRTGVLEVIHDMAIGTLRAVCVAHKDVTVRGDEDSDELDGSGFTLNAVFGIKDPLRPDVIAAVRECQAAGIFVRMVTGDNIETAKAIARECGILTEGGTAMEGPAFRKLTNAELDKVLPTLQVLARSSPSDKHTLVTRLNGANLPTNEEEWLTIHAGESYANRDLILPGYAEEWNASRGKKGGEVVGVTGDGTNDGPALKAGDVGLSMGLSGTDVAKEASDIVILDDNFSSIVKAVMWGRSVFDNIRKFLQFQLTVNIVALTLTLVSAITGREPPLNAVMMLWVNLIMDTMGALALGTEPPSHLLLKRRPYKRNASLISNSMIRNIGVQFIYQLALLAYLLLLGAEDFGVADESKEHYTVIFNAFVFCQVFNEVNARSIGDDKNVFKGLFTNPLFMEIIVFTVVAQYLMVEFAGDFMRTAALTQDQWVKSVLLGSLSLPLGGLMRMIPVRENEADFAEISPLIKNVVDADQDATKAKSAEEKDKLTPSYLAWLAVCGASVALTAAQFSGLWMKHIWDFMSRH